MTRDEIVDMLAEVDFQFGKQDWNIFHKYEAFAKLVAEKEREACVKACEEVWLDTVEAQTHNDKCVKAIRARGQT
jgi:hypothetical protein